MFNPLVEDLTKLKDTELDEKISSLGRRYMIASRTMTGAMCVQIATLIEQYKTEQIRRQTKAITDLAKKTDKNLDDLIKRD
jgi:hypothetical protein